MKKIIFLLVVSIATIFAANAQTKKTGYVIVAEVLELMPETKVARDSLKKYYASLESDFNELKKDLETKARDFEAKQKTMSPTMIEAKQKELQNLEAQLMEIQSTASERMQEKESQLLAPVLKKIDEAIQATGKEGNFDFIMNSNSIIYAKDAENATPLVKNKLGIK